MRSLCALVLAAPATIAQAQHEDHAHHDVIQARNAQIVVTINPEARVSAMIDASLPAPPACGSPMELTVKVINQGFVTAPLRAGIVGDGAQFVALHMDHTKLSGEREESRALSLVPSGPGAADVTIVFSIDNNIGDRGEHDRVHFLIRCVSPLS